MSRHHPPLLISRRSFFSSSAAIAAGAALGVPLLAGCSSGNPSSGGQSSGSQSAAAQSASGSTTSATASSATGSPTTATSVRKVDYQIAWVGDNGVLGDVVAYQKGWYKDLGLDLAFRPGGPSIDPITTTASGAATFAQTSSSPAIMLGRSQGLPVKAFASGLQTWPWAMISLPKKPVHTPQDLIGKTIGTQATGKILVQAVLAKNNIDPSKVNVQVVGSDVTPLIAGRIDVFTGWTTNLQAYEPLGADYLTLTMADAGIHCYAYPYLASDDVLEHRAEDLQAFLIATAKGWDYARQNPDEATDMLVKQFSGLQKAAQLAGGKKLMTYMFNDTTAQQGWGAMSADVWQSQLDLWAQLKQFKGTTPKVDDVMTLDILQATADKRPKVGTA
jgi:NitT/TauT family transport system substrate-binding protein